MEMRRAREPKRTEVPGPPTQPFETSPEEVHVPTVRVQEGETEPSTEDLLREIAQSLGEIRKLLSEVLDELRKDGG